MSLEGSSGHKDLVREGILWYVLCMWYILGSSPRCPLRDPLDIKLEVQCIWFILGSFLICSSRDPPDVMLERAYGISWDPLPDVPVGTYIREGVYAF